MSRVDSGIATSLSTEGEKMLSIQVHRIAIIAKSTGKSDMADRMLLVDGDVDSLNFFLSVDNSFHLVAIHTMEYTRTLWKAMPRMLSPNISVTVATRVARNGIPANPE